MLMDPEDFVKWLKIKRIGICARLDSQKFIADNEKETAIDKGDVFVAARRITNGEKVITRELIEVLRPAFRLYTSL
jgi:hypothetical protein